LVVVQELIEGPEFGGDVVAPLVRDETTPRAVYAREKLSMRAGETDRAITVDPEPFRSLGCAVADVIGSQGLIDLDVIVDRAGVPNIIDVNPRFGGGYPFMHMAGADVPQYYVRSLLKRPIAPGWDSYSH